jgi:hypothetical protein
MTVRAASKMSAAGGLPEAILRLVELIQGPLRLRSINMSKVAR